MVLPMTTPTTTGQALRKLREVAGLTLDQVAVLADVGASHLSRVENGKAWPSMKWTACVALTLGEAIAARAKSMDRDHSVSA